MPTDRAADPLKAPFRQVWYAALAAQAVGGQPINNLAARFASFADTVQTRLDSASGTGPSLTGSLEAQVDRALSQVFRQASADGPGAAGGQGTTQLVTQAWSMATTLVRGAGPPAIAPQQAALLQEATLVKNDLLSVLDTLQPLSAFADPSDIAAVSAVVRAEVNLLIDEFSRTTLRPRAQRVRVLLGSLLGWDAVVPFAPPFVGDVGTLVTLLNLGGPLVPTLLVEQQLASQGVLAADAGQLLGQWLVYQQNEPGVPVPWELGMNPRGPGGLGNLGPGPGIQPPMALGPAAAQALFRLAVIRPSGVPPAGSYAERLIQADLLLPIIGQDASRVAGALDAIGLSRGEQETTFLNLQSLVDMDLLLPGPGNVPPPPAVQPPPPPAGPPPAPPWPQGTWPTAVPVNTTVTDILDWTASMADGTTLDLLRQAGQLGLNLIADQADELFWLVSALLQPSNPPGFAAQDQMLELGDAQVQQELLTLTRDLNLLANLAV